MRRLRLLMAGVALALLSACSAISTATAPVTTPVPAQTVFATKSTYAAALIVANKYAELPRCGQPTSPPICSDVNVLRTMKKLSDSANVATQAAEDTVRTMGQNTTLVAAALTSAEKAVAAFKQITDIYGGKNG